jgi:hypothetical protein
MLFLMHEGSVCGHQLALEERDWQLVIGGLMLAPNGSIQAPDNFSL